MKFLYELLAIVLLGLVAQLFLPWWIITPLSFGIGTVFHYRSAFFSFLAGFLGGGLLWAGVAWFFSNRNDGVLAAQLGELLGGMSGPAMILTTGLMGGILAGLGAWSGTLLRALISGKKDDSSK